MQGIQKPKTKKTKKLFLFAIENALVSKLNQNKKATE